MLTKQTILLGLTGSKAYGTDTETSDTDYRGVYIPEIRYYFGLESAKEYSTSTGGENKNTKDDIDISLSPFKNFVSRCMKASPVDLELLFLRDSDYIKMTPIGEDLIQNRHMFLSKQVRNRFGGYALSESKKLENGDEGYNTKAFMHSVRLYQTAIEILTYGDFSVYRQNHQELKSLREGKYSLREARKYLNELELELRDAYETTRLPDEVDKDRVEAFLIQKTKEYLEFYI